MARRDDVKLTPKMKRVLQLTADGARNGNRLKTGDGGARVQDAGGRWLATVSDRMLRAMLKSGLIHFWTSFAPSTPGGIAPEYYDTTRKAEELLARPARRSRSTATPTKKKRTRPEGEA